MPKVIPFGNRILVKRRKVGSTLKGGKTDGGLFLPNTVEERSTDLADVTHVPDLTFSDKHILENCDQIVKNLTKKAVEGDCEALKALLEVNAYVKLKSIKVGDAVFISKYIGTDFQSTGEEQQTLVLLEDVIGLVVNEEAKNV